MKLTVSDIPTIICANWHQLALIIGTKYMPYVRVS